MTTLTFDGSEIQSLVWTSEIVMYFVFQPLALVSTYGGLFYGGDGRWGLWNPLASQILDRRNREASSILARLVAIPIIKKPLDLSIFDVSNGEFGDA